ncbi:MAG TPA: rhomboid family intramembrane serine protease [Cyclobacteriaceae bacterium]|jgi:membrane associated rhomboid family serine protease|nr:rhomboid family intramembrane serine protease [Cyclobacteriaceae bacterium]
MSITIILIGITVAISFYSFNRIDLLKRLMLNPYLIKTQGQYYRFITSGFIHKDHSHLLWNMFSFYFFGTAVELYFDSLFGDVGVYYYIFLYLSAIVISDLPTYYKHQNNPGHNALGASGGVGSLIFVFILLEPLQSICIYFALCMPGFLFGIGYMAYEYYQGKKGNDNISHDAHLYGAAYGLLFCIAFYPSSLLSFYQQVSHWIETTL